jgi:2,3-bisphosphoglycerate-independent phosphoglycerate mutase
MTSFRPPVLLVIRDGWGRNPDRAQDATNAVALARKPCDDHLRARYPHALLRASGRDVGLPDGVMGNSEVGHENIGAGRIVDQELVRLNKLFEEGLLAGNLAWRGAIARVRGSATARLHLMGIVSDAGVHGMLEHLYGILRQAKADGLRPDQVLIHAFTDGRDTPPMSGLGYVRQVEAKCRELGMGAIATVCGRFWAMDRDHRWERVRQAYEVLTGRVVRATAPSAEAAVQAYYESPLSETQKGDEFVPATSILGADGAPRGFIRDGDAVVFYNYRGDRPREITRAFVQPDFAAFDRGPLLDLHFATMTEYEKGLPVQVISGKPPPLRNILGEVVSRAGIAQFRCAETEKNPHVTFFFNNYRGEPFPGEERACPASPKVATYDLQPEMAAAEVTRLAREAILGGRHGHGRPHGFPASDDPRGRGDGCRGGGTPRRACDARGQGAGRRRPRQRGADVGPVGQWSAHRSHAKLGRGIRSRRRVRRGADTPARRRPVGRYRPYGACTLGPAPAGGDDGTEPDPRLRPSG